MSKGLSLNIGLNSVSPAHYSGWSGPLAACEADARDMFDLAVGKGFKAETILTTKATRAAVIDRISAAATKLKSGDTFFLTYSGHGGQIPDLNEDEADLEDETWCLFDGEIVDDEMAALYAKFAAGVRIVVLSDSCHSGTVTKMRAFGLSNDSNTDNSKGRRYRFMPPDVALATYRANRRMYTPILKKAPAPEPKASILLISGCQDNQLSQDGTFNGLFTGTLLKVWKDGQFVGDYRRFHREIVKRMPPDQTPKLFLTGAANPALVAEKPFTI
jgi:hypothetical protein